MNIIQTFYVNADKDLFRASFGWAAPEYHMMGWALSCLQLNEIYGNITLFANSQAAHLLIDTLKLPYSKVHLTLNKLTLPHPDLWALPKIYTYSLQEQPFLHIDGDVFLFEPFNPNLLNGELIAQNVEVATEKHYMHAQKELMRNLTYFPTCIKKDFESKDPILACNAGIIGGNNVLFFRDYTTLAFDYIFKNIDSFKYINKGIFNVFFEQHLFYALAKEKDITINVFFDGIVNDVGYTKLGDFHEVPFNKNYLHLIGNLKRDEYVCIQMAAKLRALFPEYYERIVALFHKNNIRLSPCGFMNHHICNDNNSNSSLSKRIDEQLNSHLLRLKYTANHCPPDIEKEVFQSDFEIFYSQLISFLINNYSVNELYKRDLSAQCWYRYLFADTNTTLDRVIICCPQIKIIESSFNWSGLLNKSYRLIISYYSNMQVHKGDFLNLYIPEASDNGFSLYDINELDKEILFLLSEPLSISEVLIKMKIYFEDDVIQNHYEEYKKLIIGSIKQLVLKKAIHPNI